MKRMLTLILAVLATTTACNESKFKGGGGAVHPTLTKEFTQDSYPVAQTSSVQGFSGNPEAQNFEQGEWGALDILIVIDNSGSMAEEQANLSSKLDPLLSKLTNADWQIAVVTSDPKDGCQRALIKKTDADAAQKFSEAINAGTLGNGKERQVLQAVNAIDCFGRKWVRDGSTLVTLIVSDEDNCSTGLNAGDCGTGAEADGSLLTDKLGAIRKIGQDAKVYGLIIRPTDSQCPTRDGQGNVLGNVGNVLDDIIKKTGGKSGAICDADYTTTLKAISEDVRQILKYEFDLAETPDQGTLKITVDGKDWTKFTLEGKHVKFTDVPPFGSKVEVAYKVGADGQVSSEVKLTDKAASGKMTVKVDGQVADPSTYTYDEASNAITFASEPAEKAKIEVSYQKQVKLANTFNLGLGVREDTIEVTVNGEDAEFAYDRSTGMIEITPTPPAEAKIVVTYKEET